MIFSRGFVRINIKQNKKWITREILRSRPNLTKMSDLSKKYAEFKTDHEIMEEKYFKIINNAKRLIMVTLFSELYICLNDNIVQLDCTSVPHEFSKIINTVNIQLYSKFDKDIDFDYVNSHLLLSNKSFYLSPACEDEILKLIAILKLVFPEDLMKFQVRFLKRLKTIFLSPYLINLSFENDSFLNELKFVFLKLLHIKGDPTVERNLRPMSLPFFFMTVK